ncbi:MAG: polymer-forming cytoskeletal protein [Hyphomicrobium sp.]|nr:polymer-forming cytoskeletal protein [Hyphomicrobium sp.]
MFSSDTDEAQSNFPKPPPITARSAPQGNASDRSEGFPIDSVAAAGISVIGNDLTILGERIKIVSQNKLHVEGHVIGDVHGKQVVIGKGGSVTGNVYAEKVDVCGDVRGPIRALVVVLHGTANVAGDIMSQTLSISQGAAFDGRSVRTKTPNELMPILDVEVISSHCGNAGDTT